MNQKAFITIDGNVGTGVAENMMSGKVHVKGNASQSAGATAHGGLLIIDGDTSSRCGISMKGIDIIVKGSVGHMSGFMSQSGNLIVCGDAGEALGDSLYETNIYIKGKVKSLGADCVEKKMDKKHLAKLNKLLKEAKIKDIKAENFKRYGSARKLYNFKIDNVSNY
jgi:glutamate synthase domain-containing protein 3